MVMSSVNLLGLQLSESSLSDALAALYWITYRYDFPPIKGTAFTSDSGWGCMIRSGQMLVASAMAATVAGQDWLNQSSIDEMLRKFIIQNFIDSPEHALSLHNVIVEGEKKGKRAGEWHAPSVTANCLNDLINGKLAIGLRSYCAMDMTIDASAVEALLDGSKVLIWIPMRLGVDSLSQSYFEPIKSMLCMPESLGIAGGRPNSSLYFVGHQGDNLIYLDPHYNRPHLANYQSPSNEAIETFQCREIRTIPIASIDPCFVVGFLVADVAHFKSWIEQVSKTILNEDGVALVSIIESGSKLIGSKSTTVNINDDEIISIDFNSE